MGRNGQNGDKLDWLRQRCISYNHLHLDPEEEFECALELLLRVKMLPQTTATPVTAT